MLRPLCGTPWGFLQPSLTPRTPPPVGALLDVLPGCLHLQDQVGGIITRTFGA